MATTISQAMERLRKTSARALSASLVRSRDAKEKKLSGPIANKFAGDGTANSRILNRLLRFRVGLQGLANGSAEETVKALLEVRRNLLREFADLRSSGASRLELQALGQLGRAIEAQLFRFRGTVNGQFTRELENIASIVSRAMGANVAATTADLRSVGLANLATPSEAVMRDIANQVVVGARIEEWWAKFSADQAFNLERGLAQIQRSGGSITQAIDFVANTLDRSRSDAETLARTLILGAANNASREWIRQNEDILEGEVWVATLDDRTCIQCASLDGRVFDVGKAPDIPAHPNCRCNLDPVLKDAFDLDDGDGNRAAQLTDGQQRFFSGEVPSSTTFPEWLEAQPASLQREFLGPARYDAWRTGKIELRDFVDSGRILTLDELRDRFPRYFD